MNHHPPLAWIQDASKMQQTDRVKTIHCSMLCFALPYLAASIVIPLSPFEWVWKGAAKSLPLFHSHLPVAVGLHARVRY